MAVLGAAAGLDRDDPLDLHLRPAVAHPDLVGELERVVDALVGQLEHLERLRLVEADAPLEDLLTGDVEDHAGISSSGGLPPSGSLPRTGRDAIARSSRLQSEARSGSAGHEPITMPRHSQAAALDRLDRQRGVVERAEAGAGDDDQRARRSSSATSAIVPARRSCTSSPPAPSMTTRSVERLDEVARSRAA